MLPFCDATFPVWLQTLDQAVCWFCLLWRHRKNRNRNCS